MNHKHIAFKGNTLRSSTHTHVRAHVRSQRLFTKGVLSFIKITDADGSNTRTSSTRISRILSDHQSGSSVAAQLGVGGTPKQWLKANVILIPKSDGEGYTEVEDLSVSSGSYCKHSRARKPVYLFLLIIPAGKIYNEVIWP